MTGEMPKMKSHFLSEFGSKELISVAGEPLRVTEVHPTDLAHGIAVWKALTTSEIRSQL